MNQDRKLTEKEIDELVVAQADDPNAWEDEIHVQPKRWRVNPSRIELAAKFFVLSALHRIGAEATLATGQREDVDIAVITAAGQALTVDVKALTGSTRWRVQDIRAQQNHFVIFVCFVTELHNPQVSPEVYVLPSSALRDAVAHEKIVEVHLSDLGERLNAREAWHQLVPSTAA
jgi:hypothetical protein